MKRFWIIASIFAVLAYIGGGLFADSTAFNPLVKMDFWLFKPVAKTAQTGTATTTPIRVVCPSKYLVNSIGCSAETITVSSGETYSIDVKIGATSILTAPMVISAQATPVAGTLITSPKLTKEGVLTFIVTGTGTSPSIADLNVWMYLERSN